MRHLGSGPRISLLTALGGDGTWNMIILRDEHGKVVQINRNVRRADESKLDATVKALTAKTKGLVESSGSVPAGANKAWKAFVVGNTRDFTKGLTEAGADGAAFSKMIEDGAKALVLADLATYEDIAAKSADRFLAEQRIKLALAYNRKVAPADATARLSKLAKDPGLVAEHKGWTMLAAFIDGALKSKPKDVLPGRQNALKAIIKGAEGSEGARIAQMLLDGR